MKMIALITCFLVSGFTLKSQEIPSWKINDVAAYYGKPSDSVYVVNFWATFCKPCIAEIPYLQTVTSKYAAQKVKLLLVSLDLPSFYPRQVAAFARKNSIGAEIVWLNESDADKFCPVIYSRWTGSMPATLFVNAATGYKKFFEEAMSEERFESELKKAIAGK